MADARTEVPAVPGMKVDPDALQRLLFEIRGRQSLSGGVLGGALAAAVGAALWAALTVATKFQIGYMAVGVGALVGLGVRKLGRGIDVPFAVVGAVLALVGCLAGNFLAMCGIAANEADLPYFEVVSAAFPHVGEILTESAGPIDVLFYVLAIWAGATLSRRRLTPEEIQSVLRPVPRAAV